jgi:hypothetical protein
MLKLPFSLTIWETRQMQMKSTIERRKRIWRNMIFSRKRQGLWSSRSAHL